MSDVDPEGVAPVCGRGVEDVFPVGGWTRKRIEVRAGMMSRFDAERASGSVGVADMMFV